MPDYKVAWVIDIDSDSPHGAACQALEIMRDPASTATVLTVTDDQGNRVDVDLLELERDPRVQALIDRVLAAEENARRQNATLQYRMDDLIYDHCGTSKKWSSVNNQSMETQVEALVERLGIEEAATVIEDALDQ
jgi:hypothetical protein